MVKTIEIEKIKFKELATAIKVLNESGLLEEKIATVGKSKDELVKLFIGAVQAVPDDAEGNWTGPAAVAEYYQSIVVTDAVEAPEEKQKKEKAPKEKKEKAPKEEKGRLDMTLQAIKDKGNEPFKREDIANIASAAYEALGGRNNPTEANWKVTVVTKILLYFDVLQEDKEGNLKRK